MQKALIFSPQQFGCSFTHTAFSLLFLSSHISISVPELFPHFCGKVARIQNVTLNAIFHISGRCNCLENSHLLLSIEVLGLKREE